MYFDEVWADFKELVRTDDSKIERKVKACNGGYLYLLNLMYEYSQLPEDLLQIGTGIDISYGANSASLPSDFFSVDSVHLLQSDLSTYSLITSENIYNFKDLVINNPTNFYNTSNLGSISKVAIKGTTDIYFDVYNNVYNELILTAGVSGSYTSILGNTSGATADIVSWTDIAGGTSSMIINNIATSTFEAGENISVLNNGVLANVRAISSIDLADGIKLNYFKTPTELTSTSMGTQLIELGDSYKNILALAFACYWLFFEDSSELEAKQLALIDMIKSFGNSLNIGARFNSLDI